MMAEAKQHATPMFQIDKIQDKLFLLVLIVQTSMKIVMSVEVFAIKPVNLARKKSSRASFNCKLYDDDTPHVKEWRTFSFSFDDVTGTRIISEGTFNDRHPFRSSFDYYSNNDFAIKRTSAKVAGEYRCGHVDNKRWEALQLIVLESDPRCTQDFFSDEAVEAGDDLTVSCRTDFTGLWGPFMEWKGGDEQALRTETNLNKNSVEYRFVYKVQVNDSEEIYQIQTSFTKPPTRAEDDDKTHHASNAPDYFHVIKALFPPIHYSPREIEFNSSRFIKIGESLQCSAKAEPEPYSYTLLISNGTEESVLSYMSVVLITKDIKGRQNISCIVSNRVKDNQTRTSNITKEFIVVEPGPPGDGIDPMIKLGIIISFVVVCSICSMIIMKKILQKTLGNRHEVTLLREGPSHPKVLVKRPTEISVYEEALDCCQQLRFTMADLLTACRGRRKRQKVFKESKTPKTLKRKVQNQQTKLRNKLFGKSSRKKKKLYLSESQAENEDTIVEEPIESDQTKEVIQESDIPHEAEKPKKKLFKNVSVKVRKTIKDTKSKKSFPNIKARKYPSVSVHTIPTYDVDEEEQRNTENTRESVLNVTSSKSLPSSNRLRKRSWSFMSKERWSFLSKKKLEKEDTGSKYIKKKAQKVPKSKTKKTGFRPLSLNVLVCVRPQSKTSVTGLERKSSTKKSPKKIKHKESTEV